ncbi:hypothetical protein GCM10022204_28350 [Microlunatus aurantiacus]|uniref:Uncharacterized protein n=1 Tax=Microlunatus aurantiacus TaxID=446786 RepID=A0ABP7DTA2_9ACTN
MAAVPGVCVVPARASVCVVPARASVCVVPARAGVCVVPTRAGVCVVPVDSAVVTAGACALAGRTGGGEDAGVADPTGHGALSGGAGHPGLLKLSRRHLILLPSVPPRGIDENDGTPWVFPSKPVTV